MILRIFFLHLNSNYLNINVKCNIMSLVLNLNNYDDGCILFSEPVKNNIMNYCVFIRILYSTPHVVFNAIYFDITFQQAECEMYYNKFKCHFNIFENHDIITKLKAIEESILQKHNTNKIPMFKIYEQSQQGIIKFFSENNNIQKKHNNSSFILKISGIWETQFNYGLTYKYVKHDDQPKIRPLNNILK